MRSAATTAVLVVGEHHARGAASTIDPGVPHDIGRGEVLMTASRVDGGCSCIVWGRPSFGTCACSAWYNTTQIAGWL